jgi:hypothetical protein
VFILVCFCNAFTVYGNANIQYLSFWTQFAYLADIVGNIILGNQYFHRCLAIAFKRFVGEKRNEIKLELFPYWKTKKALEGLF